MKFVSTVSEEERVVQKKYPRYLSWLLESLLRTGPHIFHLVQKTQGDLFCYLWYMIQFQFSGVGVKRGYSINTFGTTKSF